MIMRRLFFFLAMAAAVLGLSPVSLAAPANDAFATPTVLAGFPVTQNGTNAAATLESGEPLPSDYPSEAGASVWFEWTAAASGAVRVDTLGSNFSPVLAVWTGSTLAGLTKVATDADYLDGSQRVVFITAQAGVTYRIAVYGWIDGDEPEQGDFVLTIKPDTSPRITGKVTGPDGVTPLAGIRVKEYYYDDSEDTYYLGAEAFTGSDGTYLLAGLTEGAHVVQFQDYTGNYLGEYHDNAPRLDSADFITVVENEVVSGIDASLVLAAKITGTVTAADGGTPLEEIVAVLYEWDDIDEEWYGMGLATTEPDGSYRMAGLVAGTYRIGFSDWNENAYVPEFYDNAATVDEGTDIVVAASTEVSGINASLVDRARISGTVTGPDGITPLADIRVRVYHWDDEYEEWTWRNEGFTDTAGNYLVRGLSGGNYRLRFDDPAGNYVTEFYDNAARVRTAADIAVASLQETSGINASLAVASKITGTVTGPDGITPLAEIYARVYQWDPLTLTWEWLENTQTRTDGSYVLGSLAAGDYVVSFNDWELDDYQTEYYDNAPDAASATPITVGAAAIVPGIDASLAEKPRIRGIVTGPDGVTPLQGIEVRAYYWDVDYWASDQWATTGADGSYTIDRLSAGTYQVEFSDENKHYRTEYFDNAGWIGAGYDVVVQGSGDVTGIDASLAASSSIAGTVTDAAGAPLKGIWVSVFRWNTEDESWDPLQGDLTGTDGDYFIPWLNPGTYRVRYEDFEEYYATEYYSDSIDLDGATDIVLGESTIVGGIDATLAEAGHLAGTVTGPDGVTPLEEIHVTAFQWDPVLEFWDPIQSVQTDSDGSYAMRGLPAGIYRVAFEDLSHEEYATEYYDDCEDFSAATALVIAAGETVGIDASLAERSKIAGTVTGPDGVTPLPAIGVRAYVWDNFWNTWRYVASDYTEVDGSYLLTRLTARGYRIEFYDPFGPYKSEFYSNSDSAENARVVVTGISGTVSGINASMRTQPPEPAEIRIASWRVVGAGAFELDFQGEAGQVYQLQQSTDLLHWTDIGDSFNAEPGLNTIPTSSNEPRIFWRVRETP
jgi:hypothetical protein